MLITVCISRAGLGQNLIKFSVSQKSNNLHYKKSNKTSSGHTIVQFVSFYKIYFFKFIIWPRTSIACIVNRYKMTK